MSVRYLVFTLLTGPLFAQPFSFGVKGGLPVTDAFSTARRGLVSYSSVTRRYTVGPTVEVGLPLFGLRVEADALYRRIGWDSDRIGTPLLEPFHSTARFGAWDFDVLLKHRLAGEAIHPYVGAGAAFRRVFTTRENYVFPGEPSRFITKQMTDELRNKNIQGVVFSAGIEVGGAVRVAPELRYTRWLVNHIYDSYPNLSTQRNQADILVSFTFGH